MKIEAGKFYKTRDGQEVGPMGPNPKRFESAQWIWGCDGVNCSWRDDGSSLFSGEGPFDLISEWIEGPVRTVTRKEIVPGVYSKVQVYGSGTIVTELLSGKDELRAAAAVLIELAEALEE